MLLLLLLLLLLLPVAADAAAAGSGCCCWWLLLLLLQVAAAGGCCCCVAVWLCGVCCVRLVISSGPLTVAQDQWELVVCHGPVALAQEDLGHFIHGHCGFASNTIAGTPIFHGENRLTAIDTQTQTNNNNTQTLRLHTACSAFAREISKGKTVSGQGC